MEIASLSVTYSNVEAAEAYAYLGHDCSIRIRLRDEPSLNLIFEGYVVMKEEIIYDDQVWGWSQSRIQTPLKEESFSILFFFRRS